MKPKTNLRLTLLSGAAAVALMAASPLKAADLSTPAAFTKPAVDAFNGKIEGFGGWSDGRFGRDDKFSGGVLGSLTAPLGERFGAQVDGVLASRDGDFVGGGAGHLFTRDPDSYLLGVYGSAVGFDNRAGAWVGKIGGEAEAYLGRFTIAGVAGYEYGGGGSNSRETIRKGGSFFDYVDLSYYPIDDLKFSIGHRYTGRKNALALGGEYKLPVDAVDVSLFGEGRIGEKDYKSALAGLRVYFGGGEKTLIQRHRESDPTNWLENDLNSVRSRRADRIGEPPAPPECTGGLVPDGEGGCEYPLYND